MALVVVALLGVAGSSGSARAADVQVDAAYQTRARLFDTLSLNRELPTSEGFSWSMEHRLWVRPKFYPTDKVALIADLLALDNVRWGDQQVAAFDPVLREDIATLFTDDVRAPVDDNDVTTSRLDVSIWRAWIEAHTKIGVFKAGRMPLSWGMGVWQNDGLGSGDMGFLKAYGDTADRVSWEHMISNVWLRAAMDIHTDGFVNQTDETYALNLAAAYRAERLFGGLQFQYRRSNALEGQFDLFTFDAALDLRFGVVRIETEAVFQFGNGDLEGGLNDVNLFTAGGAFDASLELNKITVHAEVGWATGDDDPRDDNITTFAFDRDYNVGLFLFEQPMPVLASDVPGEARDGSVAQVGNAVSNTIYLRPRVSWEPLKGLQIDGQFLAAFIAQADQDAIDAERGGALGYEFDLGLRYSGLDHLEFGGILGVFVPDRYITLFETDDVSGFNAPAVGGQLWARVWF